MTNRTFMTVEEVAAELGVSKSYAYKIVKQLNEEFVNGCLSIHSQKYGRINFSEEKGGSAYRKKFIYPIDEIK